MPVLSIVIPTYNMDQWLPVALESCLAQTHKDIEILVVNDGSTDRTNDILNVYAKADSRLHFINQPNAGLGAARQAGQDYAQGDFLTWLDADDALVPNAAEVMLNVAVQDNVPLVCGNATVFSDKTFNTRRYFPHPPASRLSFIDSPDYWKSKVVWRWIFSVPFLRTGCNGAPFIHPHFKLGQDVCFMYDLFTHTDTFSQCGDTIYFFRQEHKPIGWTNEVMVEHELAQFVRAKEILLDSRNHDNYIKPLIKYINENYWPDIQNIAPKLINSDGTPFSSKTAKLTEKAITLTLELFKDLDPVWFNPAFLAPELQSEEDMRPLAEMAINGDRKGVTRIFVNLARVSQGDDIDKLNSFHTFRRRLKAMLSPRSREVRRIILWLEIQAKQRLGSIWPS